MKISFLIYSLGGGGAERVLVELANELSDQGFEVSILVYDAGGIKYPINSEVKIVHCREQGTVKVESYIVRLKTLRKIISAEKPDILFAFLISMIGLARLATVGLSVKVVGNERANPQMHLKQHKLLLRTIVPFCDGMVFQTKRARDYYPKRIGKKGIVIPNPAPQIKELAIAMEGYAIRICSAGRLAYPKDYQTLLRAYQKYALKYPQSVLTIYGDGVLKEELSILAKTLKIENQVIFKGFKKDMISELTQYDMFVFSSKAEGMPNVLIEAMAAGLPCISTDCDFGPAELIQNEKNGLLVPVGAVDVMAEKMCWLTENKEKAITMGKEASKIQELYSRDKIYSCYIEYLNKVNQEK